MHLHPSSHPCYLVFLIWPRPTSTSTSHCLSEGSTRRAGASPNILIPFYGWLPVFFEKCKLCYFPNPFNTCVLVMEQRLQSLSLLKKGVRIYLVASRMCVCVCIMLYVEIHACTCVGETKSQSIMHSPRWASQCVCLSPSPVRKEGWSVFSGRTPFGWGSAPLYWPLCGSLIELSCQQAAQSQCRVHYVIQTHSGAPREVLGSADNSTAPSSNTQNSVASLSLSVLAWIRKTPIFNHLKNSIIQSSWLPNSLLWKTPQFPFKPLVWV